MKPVKFISVMKSEVPAYVSQNGYIYEGNEYNLVKFEASCKEGYWGYLTDKQGNKITRGKKLCSGNTAKFGKIVFERI
jgi:hypothetical protein|uniref:Uncharacterized protein n=1 Tax=Inoviridae sp. ct6Sz5 TaxID=2826758 RepID=A0A8S5MW48_9VIRU|nr:MAG TPA: hypothetical protein [Inoviridae sp. ct6Sz5]